MRWLLLVAMGTAALFWLARPLPLDDSAVPLHEASAERGERWFHAGGCKGCHETTGTLADTVPQSENSVGGGMALPSFAGIFHVPNISPHADGIGGWSDLDFLNAMQRGVSPAGKHYFPSFPYAAYARMTRIDLLDLKAFLDTLEPVPGVAPNHELSFPWSMRWAVGLWKRLNLDANWIVDLPEADQRLQLGRYLVEGVGHCGECHTPRNRMFGLRNDAWLGGAPNPEGEGRVPNITPHADGIGDWSARDIAYYLESGVDPDFDVVGGSMVEVQENIARLDATDRAAIAAYLKAVPALPKSDP